MWGLISRSIPAIGAALQHSAPLGGPKNYTANDAIAKMKKSRAIVFYLNTSAAKRIIALALYSRRGSHK